MSDFPAQDGLHPKAQPADYTRRIQAYSMAAGDLPSGSTPDEILALAVRLDKFFRTGEVDAG